MDRCFKQLAVVLFGGAALPLLAADPIPTEVCKKFAENLANCVLAIDRDPPVNKVPIRVRTTSEDEDSKVLVTVPRAPMETVKFEDTRTEVAAPDVLGAALQKLTDPLKSLSFVASTRVPQVEEKNPLKFFSISPRPTQGIPFLEKPEDQWNYLRASLGLVHSGQTQAYREIKAWRDGARAVTKDAEKLGKWPWSWRLWNEQSKRWDEWTEEQNKQELTKLVLQIGLNEADDAKDFDKLPRPLDCWVVEGGQVMAPSTGLGHCLFPVADLQLLDEQLKRIREIWMAEPYVDGEGYREITRDIGEATADQVFLANQLAVAASAQSDLKAIGKVLKATLDNPKLQTKEATYDVVSPGGYGSSSTKITATNQLTNSALTLPSATISWQGRQLVEISAGLWFSTLEKRSYANVPVISNGQQEEVGGVKQTVVEESVSRPTVVPGVLIHLRLTKESEWAGRRTAMLGSVGIGVNDGSAEFAIGPTWAYGSVMLSTLLHIGKETSLTNGVEVGDRNAPDLKGATERDWKKRFAIGLSYRVPTP